MLRILHTAAASALLVGVALDVSTTEARATEYLFQIPSNPFYTDDTFTTLEGGAISGSFLFDDSSSTLSDISITTTAGMIITRDTTYTNWAAGSSNGKGGAAIAFGEPTALSDLANGALQDADQVLLIIVSSPFDAAVELVCQAASCAGGTVPDGAIARFAEFNAAVAAVPEPISLAVLGTGVIGLMVTRRRAPPGLP